MGACLRRDFATGLHRACCTCPCTVTTESSLPCFEFRLEKHGSSIDTKLYAGGKDVNLTCGWLLVESLSTNKIVVVTVFYSSIPIVSETGSMTLFSIGVI